MADENKTGEEAETKEVQPGVPQGTPPAQEPAVPNKDRKPADEPAVKPEDKTSEDQTGEDEDKDENEAEELDTSVWGDMGDEVANSVLLTLQNSGVTTDEAKALLWDAVQAGDPSKVDRDALVEKVGKAKANLIMAGVENVTAKNNAKIAEVTSLIEEAAGGKSNWEKARDWARAKMDPAELDEYRNMIDKGGKQARFAAQEIVNAYNADPKNTTLTAGKKQVVGDNVTPPAVEGISRLEYGKQLDILYRRGASQAEFKALSARRAAGRKQGL